jgi:[acyl-carrier-protein] S-malonyltransferase
VDEVSERAILFPGQGAQAVGMGKELAAAFPAARARFDRANAVLGYDLATLCFEGPIETLTISAHAQPGIFVASVAALDVLKERRPDLTFAAAAGLSSGEWTALYAAGVVSFDDTLRILDARGRFMTEACRQAAGGMLAIVGAEKSVLETICRETGVEMANLNSHEQTVLSGAKEAVDAAEQQAKALGIRKAIRLNVAGAFHSALMKTAADRFAEFLAGIPVQAPSFPVISNVTAAAHGGPEEIRRLMAAQIVSPVNWVGSVEGMAARGIHAYLECGPGKVLSGLVKRIDKAGVVHSIQDVSGLEGMPF